MNKQLYYKMYIHTSNEELNRLNAKGSIYGPETCMMMYNTWKDHPHFLSADITPVFMSVQEIFTTFFGTLPITVIDCTEEEVN